MMIKKYFLIALSTVTLITLCAQEAQLSYWQRFKNWISGTSAQVQKNEPDRKVYIYGPIINNTVPSMRVQIDALQKERDRLLKSSPPLTPGELIRINSTLGWAIALKYLDCNTQEEAIQEIKTDISSLDVKQQMEALTDIFFQYNGSSGYINEFAMNAAKILLSELLSTDKISYAIVTSTDKEALKRRVEYLFYSSSTDKIFQSLRPFYRFAIIFDNKILKEVIQEGLDTLTSHDPHLNSSKKWLYALDSDYTKTINESQTNYHWQRFKYWMREIADASSAILATLKIKNNIKNIPTLEAKIKALQSMAISYSPSGDKPDRIAFRAVKTLDAYYFYQLRKNFRKDLDTFDSPLIFERDASFAKEMREKIKILSTDQKLIELQKLKEEYGPKGKNPNKEKYFIVMEIVEDLLNEKP